MRILPSSCSAMALTVSLPPSSTSKLSSSVPSALIRRMPFCPPISVAPSGYVGPPCGHKRSADASAIGEAVVGAAIASWAQPRKPEPGHAADAGKPAGGEDMAIRLHGKVQHIAIGFGIENHLVRGHESGNDRAIRKDPAGDVAIAFTRATAAADGGDGMARRGRDREGGPCRLRPPTAASAD